MTKRVPSLIAGALSIVFAFAGATSQSPAPPVSPRPALSLPPARKVRIGLTTDPLKVHVSAEGGIVVRDPAKKAPIWKKKFGAGIYLVGEVSGGGEKGLLYRVQVASFASKEQADA